MASGVVVLAVAFALGTYVVVPLAVGAVLDEWAAAAPGRRVAVGRVAVNPFTLTVTLHDSALDAPGVSVETRRIALDFDVAALLGGGFVLDLLDVDAPRVTLGAEARPADAGWDAFAPAAPFEIAHATIDGGRIEWHDDAGEPLVVDGVSVRAFDVARPAATRARVEIDARNAVGGVLRLSGEIDVGTLAADGRMLFENVDVAPIAARFPGSPSVAGVSSGAADFEWRGRERTLRLGAATLRVLRAELGSADGDALSAASLEAAGDAELLDGKWRLAAELDLLRPSLRLAGSALDAEAIDARIEYRVAAGGIEGDVRFSARGLAIEQAATDPGGPSIELALALLEDPRGVVETAYVFSAPNDGTGIGRVLASSVVEQLDAVASAPLDVLAAAASVDAATLAPVSFPPGEAEPVELETLDAWAEALAARPRIGVRVQGVADRVVDRDALAARQIELHVTLETAGPTLVTEPQPVDFASPRHQDLLEEFVGERLGAERRETIASYFTRGPDGRVVEAERDAYYRALFDALVENEAIPESGIARLGRYRALAIADALTERGVADTRIELARAVVRSATGGGADDDAPPDGADDDAPPDGADGDATGDDVEDDASTEVEPPRIQVPLEVFALGERAAEDPTPPLGAR
ncbi:MAG TPA: DUF748 domain-containing protein [Gammaproteobacteria bacterium]